MTAFMGCSWESDGALLCGQAIVPISDFGLPARVGELSDRGLTALSSRSWFSPHVIFFFFVRGVIRPISPHHVAASRLAAIGSSVVVGRNGLDFAPGGATKPAGGENSGSFASGGAILRDSLSAVWSHAVWVPFEGKHFSRENAKMIIIPPSIFDHLGGNCGELGKSGSGERKANESQGLELRAGFSNSECSIAGSTLAQVVAQKQSKKLPDARFWIVGRGRSKTLLARK